MRGGCLVSLQPTRAFSSGFFWGVSDGTRTRDRLDHNQESSRAGQPLKSEGRHPYSAPVDVYQAATPKHKPGKREGASRSQ